MTTRDSHSAPPVSPRELIERAQKWLDAQYGLDYTAQLVTDLLAALLACPQEDRQQEKESGAHCPDAANSSGGATAGKD